MILSSFHLQLSKYIAHLLHLLVLNKFEKLSIWLYGREYVLIRSIENNEAKIV